MIKDQKLSKNDGHSETTKVENGEIKNHQKKRDLLKEPEFFNTNNIDLPSKISSTEPGIDLKNKADNKIDDDHKNILISLKSSTSIKPQVNNFKHKISSKNVSSKHKKIKSEYLLDIFCQGDKFLFSQNLRDSRIKPKVNKNHQSRNVIYKNMHSYCLPVDSSLRKKGKNIQNLVK